MQLTVAAVTPSAEHAARRPAGAADAAAADAGASLRGPMIMCEAAIEQIVEANGNDEWKGRVG